MGRLRGLIRKLTLSGPTTINGPLTVNGPITVNMDATHAGVTVNGHAGSLAQPLRVFDHLGNPISGANSDGAALWAAGDDILVFPPGDVFNPVVRLGKLGMSTVVSLRLGGPSGVDVYGGVADPNVTSPCSGACRPGSWYLRSDGTLLTFVNDTWVVKS